MVSAVFVPDDSDRGNLSIGYHPTLIVRFVEEGVHPLQYVLRDAVGLPHPDRGAEHEDVGIEGSSCECPAISHSPSSDVTPGLMLKSASRIVSVFTPALVHGGCDQRQHAVGRRGFAPGWLERGIARDRLDHDSLQN